MLFRVGLVTLLLGGGAGRGGRRRRRRADVAGGRRRCSGSSSPPTGSPSSSRVALPRVGAIVGDGWRRRRSAPIWSLTTLLVHLTGGAESAFAFMYILVIVGAAFVLGRGALAGGGGGGRCSTSRDGVGCCSVAAAAHCSFARCAVNAVAFAATGALATRLAVELRRAGEHIASQGLQAARSGGAARGRHPRPDLGPGHRRARRPRRSPSTPRRPRSSDAAASEAIGRPLDEIMPGLAALQASVGRRRALRRGEVGAAASTAARAAHARRVAVAARRLERAHTSGASSTSRI